MYKNKMQFFSLIILGLIISCRSLAQKEIELVVIDEAVERRDDIINSLNDNLHVIILKQSNTQFRDLKDSLKNYKNLKAMHLLLCGKDGEIMLNGSPITNENIGNLSEDLSQWKESFIEEADLLIYTCRLAGSRNGKLVVRRLAAYTGLDVAASVNDTGNYGNQADWKLEFMNGSIETSSCFDFEKIRLIPGNLQRSVSLQPAKSP